MCIITVWFSLISVLMLTWIRREIFCCFLCFKCWKDDPKDAVGPNRRGHRVKRRHKHDDEFDDDDSDAENNGSVMCNRPTTCLEEIFCCPLIKLMFLLIYFAPVLFITGAALYHIDYGIYHLHKLSVKE